MADRQLQAILDSGEITGLMLNGNALGHDVLTRDEIKALLTTGTQNVGLIKSGNGYCLEINTTPQTGTAAVNLMSSGDGVQAGMVYVQGVKYSALTQFQIDALANLEAGTTVYNTTSKALQLYIGSKWVDLYAGDILKDYRYKTADTSPATGEVTLNDTDLTAATLLRVHHTDDDGDDVSAILIAVQVGSVVELEGNQQKAVYNVTAINDQTNHTEYTVTWASGDVTTPFTDGQKVLFDIPDSAGGGVSKFTELDDVPGSYIGHAGETVMVKATEDGVEFLTPTANEPPLGNPTTDGDILASTAAGVRSWVGAPSGLEKLTESGQTGWRIVGAAVGNYGDIGADAVDLSQSNVTSTTNGATGAGSFLSGVNNEASGDGSSSIGGSINKAQGDNSIVLGGMSNRTGAAAPRSVILGGSNQVANQPNMVYMMGMRLKPLTQAQIDSMTPEEGTHVWNSTLQAEQVYDGNEWRIEEMTSRLSEFKFETAITTPPGVGKIRTDNADPSLATKIYVSEQNDHGHDVSTYMNKLVPGNRLTILGADQFVSYTITTLIKSGTYYDIGVTVIDSELATPFANGHPVLLQGIAPATTEPSGLEKITESGNTGWRLVGANPAFYGDIGDDAVDLSISNGATATRGATGHYATAIGLNTISSGGASFAGGQVTEASGSSSFAFGWNTKATQNRAVAFGTQVHATGENSFASGNVSLASGTSATAMNQRSHASGSYSFCGGYGESVADYAVSSGTNSSVFSHVQAGQGHKEAAADDSAILGGRNNEVAAGAQQAAVIGGGDVSATQASTVYVPSLVIGKGTYQQGSAAGIAGELGHLRVNGTDLEFFDGTGWKVVTLNP